MPPLKKPSCALHEACKYCETSRECFWAKTGGVAEKNENVDSTHRQRSCRELLQQARGEAALLAAGAGGCDGRGFSGADVAPRGAACSLPGSTRVIRAFLEQYHEKRRHQRQVGPPCAEGA